MLIELTTEARFKEGFMKITFLNEPDPMGIMRTLAELLTKESGGEYIYNVCEDGKAVTDEKNK